MNDRVVGLHCSNGLCEFDSHTTTKNIKLCMKQWNSGSSINKNKKS